LNAKTELLPLLVIYGKLVRTTMFNSNTVFAINGTLFFPVHRKIPLMVNIEHHGFYPFTIWEIYNNQQ
jgi:hypothetical protein